MKLLGKYRNLKEMTENEDLKTLEKIFKHGKPLTRRDFLASGAHSFAASLALPSAMSLILSSKSSQAQECGKNLLPSLVTLNLSGGAAMSGNIIPLDQGRQMLKSYTRLGLGSSSALANRIVSEFGGTKFYDGSGMLSGIRSIVTQDTIDKTACIAIWCESQDDSASNKFSMDGLAIAGGLKGAILPNLGARNTASGIRQEPAFKPPPRPLVVDNVSAISNALGVNGSLNALTDTQKSKLFTLINRLSSSQARQISSDNGGTVLGELVKSATGDNITLVSSANNGTDPLRDSQVADQFDTIWADNGNNLSAITNMGNRNLVFSHMVYNALSGNAASIGLELGGYDYHGNTRVSQTQDDFNAGVKIGQILQSANAMQKATFLIVTSDGSVGSAESETPGAANYTSDRGQGGGMYIFAFDPSGRPEASDSTGKADFQVGHYKPGTNEQAADDSFLTGGNPELATIAAFANYCSFAGKPSMFTNVMGGLWNSSQIDLVTRIKKKTG